jgi:alpha-beta hydrolase superfamily lysophospholipase
VNGLEMLTFVLVHGAFHDGSAWEAVISRLRQRGHEAFGPTMAGHGKGVDRQVTHAESTQSVIDFIVERGLTDVVLLGHSYDGTIICKVAEVEPVTTTDFP